MHISTSAPESSSRISSQSRANARVHPADADRAETHDTCPPSIQPSCCGLFSDAEKAPCERASQRPATRSCSPMAWSACTKQYERAHSHTSCTMSSKSLSILHIETSKVQASSRPARTILPVSVGCPPPCVRQTASKDSRTNNLLAAPQGMLPSMH